MSEKEETPSTFLCSLSWIRKQYVPEEILQNAHKGRSPQSLHEEERREQWDNARKKHEEILISNPQQPILIFGSMRDFHLGIGALLGHPQKLLFEAMEREHCKSADSNDEFFSYNYRMTTTSRIEWYFVTNPSKENLDKLEIDEWPKEETDCPHPRVPTPLDSLEDTLTEYNAKLAEIGVPEMTLIEVIACRLHTGPMGPKFNKILRYYGKRDRDDEDSSNAAKQLDRPYKGNTYTTTIHVLQSAISKLGKINPHRFAYSGIDALLLPECAWEPDSILATKGGVLSGLMGLTRRMDVARQYASRDGGKVGIIFNVDMATMDRGADVTKISQYPHEEETLLPPLTYLHIEHIQLDITSDASQKAIWIVEARSRISQSIQVEMPLLTEEEKTAIREGSKSSSSSSSPSAPHQQKVAGIISRFTGVENYLITGNPMKSVRGLPYFLGVDENKLKKSMSKELKGMREEILKSRNEVVIENMRYVFDEEASEKLMPTGFIRDKGNAGKRLKYFANLDHAKRNGLSVAHVAALRLYTTPAFEYINNPLRNPNEDDGVDEGNVSQTPHPFPVTVSFIDEGLRRLRGSNAKLDKYPTLWRGFKNIRIPDSFIENGRGGTELGLMSTTDDLTVAVKYSKSAQGSALLFKIRLENLKQCGADISWLSTISSESEFLYPPLTFLQPTGRVQTVTAQGLFFTVVEVQPHI